MSHNTNITKKERDCLVSIGNNTKNGFPIKVVHLAKSLNIKPPTVENLLKRLQKKKLIVKKDGMVLLSEEGKAVYRKIILGHRVLETFLVQCGDDVNRACKMISNFDYLIDENTALLILEKIGRPTKCPHGHPIFEKW